jgi:hypothetical protein
MFKIGRIPWNKGKTHKTDKRVARPWLGKNRDDNTKLKISIANTGKKRPWVKGFQTGHKHSEETKKKLSLMKLGDKNPMKRLEVSLLVSKALKGRKVSDNTKNKIREANIGHHRGGWKFSEEARKKISKSHKGEKSILWKGGITEKNKSIRNGIEYRLWREAVFARDNWTCQKCKVKGVKTLQAHHIKSFSKNSELRFIIDNGITLCKKCHLKSHLHKF